MLQNLSIKNYTLIDNLNIDFSNGFSVITGETGAGKSMLLGALGLILGKRADLSVLKKQDEKCVIEATFSVGNYELQSVFNELDLDYDATTIIRREILNSGKSRAFVNDSPVSLNQLEALGELLMDIHSQNNSRELSEEAYQFDVLDTLVNNKPLLEDYQNELSQYKKQKKKLEELKAQVADLLKEKEFNSFLLNELVQANLLEGEQEELEASLDELSNAEAIKEALLKSVMISDDENSGIYQQINDVRTTLQKISAYSAQYASFYERVEALQIELKDLVDEMHRASENINDDPKELERVSAKLQLLYSLQKKHQLNTEKELIDLRESLSQKVTSVEDLDIEIIEITSELKQKESILDDYAEKLHQNRVEAVAIFNERVTSILAELGMKEARFDIKLHQKETYHLLGKDQIEFLFSANKGGSFGPLKKTASGGEFSRIMLAIKSVLADYKALPTIIFDEIDTGVSGEVATKMAEIMKIMGQNRQVLSITHLPQIASKGKYHYKVYKSVLEDDTVSDLKLLSQEERVAEIAEMISGKNYSDSALTHAKSLLLE